MPADENTKPVVEAHQWKITCHDNTNVFWFFIAGIKKGDVITKVNGSLVTSGLEMSAQIASFKPGDEVPITYTRNGKEYTATVTLKESAGKVDVIAATNINEILGAELETLTRTKADAYGLEGGVVVKKIKERGPLSRTRMQEGFIITSVNGRDVTSVEDLSKLLSGAYGTVKLEGMYPGSEMYTYPLTLGDD